MTPLKSFEEQASSSDHTGSVNRRCRRDKEKSTGVLASIMWVRGCFDQLAVAVALFCVSVSRSTNTEGSI